MARALFPAYNLVQEGCLDKECASIFEEVLWTAAQADNTMENLLPVLIALRVQATLHHLRGDRVDWDACQATAVALLSDKEDNLAPACSKSYKELIMAVQSAQALKQQTGESDVDARNRVLRLYKPYRVVKALDAATTCLQARFLLQGTAEAASSEQLHELLQKDWSYLGACLGSSSSNGVAALIAHLQAALQKAVSRRMQEDSLAKASTCSGLQASPEPGQKPDGTLLSELLASLEDNNASNLAMQDVVPDTDPIGSGEVTSQQAASSESLGLEGVADLSGSSYSQEEKEKHNEEIAQFVDRLVSPTVSQQRVTSAQIRPQLGHEDAAGPLQDEPVWQRKKQMRLSCSSKGQQIAPGLSYGGVIEDLESPQLQGLAPPDDEEGLSEVGDGADAAETQSSRDLWGKLMFEPAKVRPSQRSDLKNDSPQQKRNQEGLTNTDLRHADSQGQQAVVGGKSTERIPSPAIHAPSPKTSSSAANIASSATLQPLQRSKEHHSRTGNGPSIASTSHLPAVNAPQVAEDIASKTARSNPAIGSALQGSLLQKAEASQGIGKGPGSWSWLGLAEKAVPKSQSMNSAEVANRGCSEVEAGHKENLHTLKTAKITHLVEAAKQQRNPLASIPTIVPRSYQERQQRANRALRSAMKAQPAISSPQLDNADFTLASLEQLLGFDPTLESKPRSKLRDLPQPASSSPQSLSQIVPREEKAAAAADASQKALSAKAVNPPKKLAIWMTATTELVAANQTEKDAPAMPASSAEAERRVSSKWYTTSALAVPPAMQTQPKSHTAHSRKQHTVPQTAGTPAQRKETVQADRPLAFTAKAGKGHEKITGKEARIAHLANEAARQGLHSAELPGRSCGAGAAAKDMQQGNVAPLPQTEDHRKNCKMPSGQPPSGSLSKPLLPPPQNQIFVSPTVQSSLNKASKVMPKEKPGPSLGQFSSWLTPPKKDASSCILPSSGASALEKLAHTLVQNQANSLPQLKHLHSLPCPASSMSCHSPERAPTSQSKSEQRSSPEQLEDASAEESRDHSSICQLGGLSGKSGQGVAFLPQQTPALPMEDPFWPAEPCITMQNQAARAQGAKGKAPAKSCLKQPDQPVQPPKQVRLVVLPNPRKQLENKNSSLTPHPSNWCKKARQTKKKREASCLRAPAGKENRMRGIRGAYRSPAQIIFKHKKVSSAMLHSRKVPAFKHNVQGLGVLKERRTGNHLQDQPVKYQSQLTHKDSVK